MYTQMASLETSASQPGKGMVEYHVAYVGDFKKGDDPFTIDQARIDNWRDAINEMVAEGIDVPAPAEHNLDPEATRAYVLSARTGPDSKGRYSLWAVCGRFKDERTYQNLKDSKVSLWAPPGDFKSPTSDKVWPEPIRHLAFTGYPVLPGLDASKGLALSHLDRLTEAPTKAPTMQFTDKAKAALKKMGIQFADDASDDTILTGLEGFEPTPPITKDPEKPLEPSAASQINVLRGMVLSSMVGVHITPAQLEKFRDQNLAAMPEATFNSMVEGLKLSTLPVGKQSKTPGQGTEVDEGNGLMKAVERLAAKTK